MSNILSPSQKASSAKVRERILVVEYEGFVSMVLSEHLREAGFDVVEAKNADDALSAMEISVPDLIITDVRMPGSMDGLALLAVVREASLTLPVIITSGNSQPTLHTLSGIAQFVAKPYSIYDMIAAARTMLAMSSSGTSAFPLCHK